MSEQNFSSFKSHINALFEVSRSALLPENDATATPPAGISLKLVDVTETNRDTHDSVSLIFHGPAGVLLPQKTYRMSSEGFGEQDVFIVPVGETDEVVEDGKKGYVYQAIFSKLKKK